MKLRIWREWGKDAGKRPDCPFCGASGSWCLLYERDPDDPYATDVAPAYARCVGCGMVAQFYTPDEWYEKICAGEVRT